MIGFEHHFSLCYSFQLMVVLRVPVGGKSEPSFSWEGKKTSGSLQAPHRLEQRSTNFFYKYFRLCRYIGLCHIFFFVDFGFNFFFFLQTFKNVTTISNSRAIQRQTAGWIWPVGFACPLLRMSVPLSSKPVFSQESITWRSSLWPNLPSRAAKRCRHT